MNGKNTQFNFSNLIFSVKNVILLHSCREKSKDLFRVFIQMCTKNIQRLEEGLETTKCSFWTWSDPSGREYNNICRFHREDVSLEYNGGTISGPEGCYALWNC